MSTPLEQRYRRVLKLLPPYYRADWEEDMVSAFLDSMTTGDPEMDEVAADLGRPGIGELASVGALAIRLRLGGSGAPPRYFAWGQAVRRAVLIVTMMQAAIALPSLVIILWEAWPDRLPARTGARPVNRGAPGRLAAARGAAWLCLAPGLP